MTELAAEILEIDTTQPGTEELLLGYSRHEETMVRSNALEMLRDFDSEAVVKRMGEVLDDEEEDELVVVEALEWVTENEMKQFYPVVVDLLDDPSDMLRDYAALALIYTGTESDVAMLEEKLARAPDENKPTLLYALANLGDTDRYVDDYLLLLKHDDWLIRRWAIANAANLAEIADPKLVIEKLEDALETETQKGNIPRIQDALKEIAELN